MTFATLTVLALWTLTMLASASQLKAARTRCYEGSKSDRLHGRLIAGCRLTGTLAALGFVAVAVLALVS